MKQNQQNFVKALSSLDKVAEKENEPEEIKLVSNKSDQTQEYEWERQVGQGYQQLKLESILEILDKETLWLNTLVYTFN